jgi:hypothetical protein
MIERERREGAREGEGVRQRAGVRVHTHAHTEALHNGSWSMCVVHVYTCSYMYVCSSLNLQ